MTPFSGHRDSRVEPGGCHAPLVHRSRNPAVGRPVARHDAGGLPGARWLDAENYNLTLRFIGDIDDALAREIAGVLARVHRRPFELDLNGLTSFGGRKPRALVASAAPVPPLMELQAEHERLLQRLGLEPEGRKYAPHVTLARLRNSRAISCRLPCRAGTLSLDAVSGIALCAVSSHASVGGGPYIVEEAYPLTRQGADRREARMTV